jgi:hypothetical protein
MAKAESNVATSPWGTPDPRDSSAYPTVANTAMRQWAWEFLRRRSDYRVRWDQKVRPFFGAHGDWDEAAIDRDHEECVKRARQEGRHYRWVAPWSALEEEFRVVSSATTGNGVLDPRCNRPPLFGGESIAQVAMSIPRPPEHPLVILEFDLKLPVEIQIENARQLLLRRQARYFPHIQRDIKMPVAKFPLYLRLLDFEEVDAPDREIGEHLFPHALRDRLRDIIGKTVKAARKWQDDYLAIALRSPVAS